MDMPVLQHCWTTAIDGVAGVGLQVLQQAAGINTIMYFTVSALPSVVC